MSRVERETHWVIDDLYPNQLDPTVGEERCPDPPAGTVALLAWSSAAGRPAPGLLSGVPVIRFMSCDLRVLMDQPTDPKARCGRCTS
jgi:hypothetical protein